GDVITINKYSSPLLVEVINDKDKTIKLREIKDDKYLSKNKIKNFLSKSKESLNFSTNFKNALIFAIKQNDDGEISLQRKNKYLELNDNKEFRLSSKERLLTLKKQQSIENIASYNEEIIEISLCEEKAKKIGNEKSLIVRDFHDNESGNSSKHTFKFNETKQREHSFTWSTDFTLGVSANFKLVCSSVAGIDIGGQFQAKSGISNTVKETDTETTEKSLEVVCPPWKKMQVVSEIKKTKLTIPYTASIKRIVGGTIYKYLVDGEYSCEESLCCNSSNKEIAARNILLVGCTGSRKSTLAKVLSGDDSFEEGSGSVSKTKFFKKKREELIRIGEAISSAHQGLSQVLFVFSGRLSDKEKEGFGKLAALKITNSYITLIRSKFVNFGNKEACKKDEQALKEESPEISQLLNNCRGLLHIDNDDDDEYLRKDSREEKAKLENEKEQADNIQKKAIDQQIDILKENTAAQVKEKIQGEEISEVFQLAQIVQKENNPKIIILIGSTGKGKSTLANVMVNVENKFIESGASVSGTREIQKEEFIENNINFAVIDTVGMGDTKLKKEEVLDKIAEAVYLAREGISQVFFVIDDKFNPHEMANYDLLKTIIFDQEVVNHTTIVRTRFKKFKESKECEKDIELMIGQAIKSGKDDFRIISQTDVESNKVELVSQQEEKMFTVERKSISEDFKSGDEKEFLNKQINKLREEIKELEEAKKLKREIEEKEKAIRQAVLKHLFKNYNEITEVTGGSDFIDNIGLSKVKVKGVKDSSVEELLSQLEELEKNSEEKEGLMILSLKEIETETEKREKELVELNKQDDKKSKPEEVLDYDIKQLKSEYYEQLGKEVDIFDKHNQQLSQEEEISKKTANILIIGRIGSGKSTLANLLFNKKENFEKEGSFKKVFKEGGSSVSKTKKIQVEEFEDSGIRYRIVDTVGIGNTSMSLDKVLRKLALMGYSVKDGLSQILFVTDGRLAEEENSTYDLLKKVVFDESIAEYTTIVRTNFAEIIYVDNPPVDIADNEEIVNLNMKRREKSREMLLEHLRNVCQD
ncbi:1356_t:CDS:2, partial [Paraglomus brasilianum]